MVFTLMNRPNLKLNVSQIICSYNLSISCQYNFKSDLVLNIPSASPSEFNCQIFLFHISLLYCFKDFCQLGCYRVYLGFNQIDLSVHISLDRVHVSLNLFFLCIHTGLDRVDLGVYISFKVFLNLIKFSG